MPLTTMVLTMAKMATLGRAVVVWSPEGSIFDTDSSSTWQKETTIMMEKTRMPRGSRRRRPTLISCQQPYDN